ncbi:protein-tyrosine phosphatase [Enterococcus sp. DIV2402]|uniref:Protein-tyrosine phosphatase n=1 Tax=Candidatus Enterococcus lowellii TaxID=2230877 RepID=A0ABZ2SNP0_9ENTE|nr:tyrosine-protein phosphatase [Enterococcus sp. DIV2402]MBO0464039.1 tyrosine-protein phosphatase [Enterococcus sp. DIV2402]
MTKILNLEGTFNTRDIGGIKNKEGKTVKYGKMIRSDALGKLTDSDVKFLEDYGVKTVVDFRGIDEVIKAPDKKIGGVREINLSPNAPIAAVASGNIIDDQKKIDALLKEAATEDGRNSLRKRTDEMAEQMKELVNTEYANKQYTQFLNLLSDESNLGILHHCKGGKDRTGFGAMITLFALDVSEEEVKKDYMLTKKMMEFRNEKRMSEYRKYTDNDTVLEYLSGLMSTKEMYYDAAIKEMKRMAGSIDDYLEQYLHLTREKKQKIKENFLSEN